MLYYENGNENADLSAEDMRAGLHAALEKLGRRKKVLAVPPDITRLYSRAGELTEMAWEYFGPAMTDVLPAIGTHFAMTEEEIAKMFGAVPSKLFRVHDWREGVLTLGRVPAEFVRQVSDGRYDADWPCQVDRLLVEGGFDLILSVGQIVPHEVVGMAGFNKNIFIGTGGVDGINRSHYLGAVCEVEKILGRADTSVRRVLNYASEHFARDLPIVYVLTVIEDVAGKQITRGLFIGDNTECFDRAAALSLQVNLKLLDAPLQKTVVYLDPTKYKSTWLGNKSIYRTRMAMAEDGELIVLAPGLREFGEDAEIDRIIRKYGYVGTPAVMKAVAANVDIQQNLGAAAHLMQSSSEGRFRITYCPGLLSREEIESVNFEYADLGEMMQRYDPAKLTDGFNQVDGETIFYISNPALGLWSTRRRFYEE